MVAKKPAAAKAAGAVPESVLKKRKRDEEWGAKKAAALTEAKTKAKDRRKEIFKRAETYVKEYRDQVGSSQAKLPPSASLQQQPQRDVCSMGYIIMLPSCKVPMDPVAGPNSQVCLFQSAPSSLRLQQLELKQVSQPWACRRHPDTALAAACCRRRRT
jgi:hypothetical protein